MDPLGLLQEDSSRGVSVCVAGNECKVGMLPKAPEPRYGWELHHSYSNFGLKLLR
jgi:hypothetical protein